MNPNHIVRLLLLPVLLGALSACGGGGSGPNPGPEPKPDTLADEFTFGEVHTAGSGQRFIGWVTVSGLSDGVTVTATLEDSTTSDLFLYINGAAFENSADPEAAHQVQNGDSIGVGVTAADEVSTTVGVTLRLVGEDGVVSDRYDVTTRHEFDAPELVVHFPPPFSLTDVPLPGGIIRMRGVASDESGLSAIHINDAEASLDADGTWYLDYAVLPGDNLVEVTATDELGNESVETLTIRHVATRDGVNFGTGSGIGNPVSALWDGSRERLLGGTVFQLIEIDLEIADRSTLSDSLAGGVALIHDIAGDRYLAAKSGGTTGTAIISSFDPETGVATEISRTGDGNGPDTDFRWPEDLTYIPDGKRIFARMNIEANTGSRLWEIDGDPASPTFGARSKFSNENFHVQMKGLAYDETRDRILIGNCDLRAIPGDAPAGTASTVIIPQAVDFCVFELIAAGNTAWGRSQRAGADFIVVMDLAADSYGFVSDLDDAALGPMPEVWRSTPGLDVDRGIYYLFNEGAVAAPDTMFAIDLVNGYRVVVTQAD